MTQTPGVVDRRFYWLSFAGEHGFLGACVVPVTAAEARLAARIMPPGRVRNTTAHAEWIAAAIYAARTAGCNPGGEVQAVELPVDVEASWCGRLLSQAEADELSALLT